MPPLMDGRTNACFGVRAFDGYTSHSFLFVMGNKGVTLACNVLFNVYLHDIMTCHKMIRTDVFKTLPLQSPGFAIEPEITARLVQRGERIFEVPVHYRARATEEGKKLTALSTAFAWSPRCCAAGSRPAEHVHGEPRDHPDPARASRRPRASAGRSAEASEVAGAAVLAAAHLSTIVCLALAALSAAVLPTVPSYDPWSWIVWGREIVNPHLGFSTGGGPSWKPLPVIFTAPYGLFERRRADAVGDHRPRRRLAVAGGGLPAGLQAHRRARRGCARWPA